MTRHEHWYKNGRVHVWESEFPVNATSERLITEFVHGCWDWEKRYAHLHGMPDVLFDRYVVSDGTRTFTYPPAL